MGWEKDGYCRRSVRENGKVCREYWGKGATAEYVAMIDAERRRIREERQAVWRERKQKLAELDEPVNELNELTNLVMTAALISAGYHQHKGQWRKRRDGN